MPEQRIYSTLRQKMQCTCAELFYYTQATPQYVKHSCSRNDSPLQILG